MFCRSANSTTKLCTGSVEDYTVDLFLSYANSIVHLTRKRVEKRMPTFKSAEMKVTLLSN
jgi:hypothetical protein